MSVSYFVEASAYQRLRLWCGITSIGWNLSLILGLAGWAWLWGGSLDGGAQLGILLAAAVGIPLSNLALDVLAGHALETARGTEVRPLSGWLRDWMGGRAAAAFGLAIGFGIFWSTAMFSLPWWVPLAAAAVVAIAIIGSLSGGRAAAPSQACRDALRLAGMGSVSIVWFRADEASALNGYTLPWRRGVVFVSDAAQRLLTDEELAALIAREQWLAQTGRSAGSAAIALAWAAGGLGMAFALPAPNPLAAAFSGCAMLTVWSFVALFIWPAWNRRLMADADQFLASVIGSGAARAVLAKVQAINGTDTELSAAKTSVFHPIPPLNDRLQRIP